MVLKRLLFTSYPLLLRIRWYLSTFYSLAIYSYLGSVMPYLNAPFLIHQLPTLNQDLMPFKHLSTQQMPIKLGNQKTKISRPLRVLNHEVLFLPSSDDSELSVNSVPFTHHMLKVCRSVAVNVNGTISDIFSCLSLRR